MTNRTREVVERAVREILDGTQATARPIGDAESALSDHAIFVAGRLQQPLPTSAALADALTAAYHLGRRHAMERMAVGLSLVEGAMDDAEAELNKMTGR